MNDIYLKANAEQVSELLYKLSGMVVQLVLDEEGFCRLCGEYIAVLNDSKIHSVDCDYRQYHELALALQEKPPTPEE